MNEISLIKTLVALGVPGVALGIFYLLARRFEWKISRVPAKWAGPLALVFICVIGYVAIHAMNRFSTPASATLHITVLDPEGSLEDDAHVTTSPGGEIRKTDGGWQAEIPSERLSSDNRVTVYAEAADKGFKGKADAEAVGGKHVAVEIRLIPPPEAEVSGRVVDESREPVSGAKVSVTGFENEAVTTAADGLFRLPAHAPDGDQVRIRVHKQGMKETTLWHIAGEPLEIMVRKGE